MVRRWLVEKDAREQQASRIDAAAAERRHCLGADIAGPLNGFILGVALAVAMELVTARA